MSEPFRLLERGATDVERALLEAGVAEEPGGTGVRRAAAALGLMAVVSTGTAAAAAPVLAGKAGALVVLKWGAVVLLGGVGLAVGAVWLRHHAPAAPPAPVPAAVAPVTALPKIPGDMVSAPSPSASAAEPTVRHDAHGRVAPADRATSLHEEVAMLDTARRALGGGNATGALSALDHYAATCPRGLLGEEATLLRIEALAQSGNRTAAAQLAKQFLASHPDSPHAKRLGTLLGAAR
jgi:hypothetical protein